MSLYFSILSNIIIQCKPTYVAIDLLAPMLAIAMACHDMP
jgi:hypothetical protein